MPHDETRGGPRRPDGRPRPPAGPGKFSERTDLSEPPVAQGVYVDRGLPYGTRGRIERGQRAAPLPNRRVRPRISERAQVESPLAQLLLRPTIFPDEPVTAGLPIGAGAGPEVLPRRDRPSLVQLLAALPGASEEIKALAEELQAFEPEEGEIALEF